jgi:hypothetical protein
MQKFRVAENTCIQYRLHYIRSHAVIFYIHRQRNPTHHILELRHILTQNNVHFQPYTWRHFNRSMVIYIRTSLWHNHKYIGMSTVSTPAREASRDRKYHQLQRGALAKYELAILWWHHTKTFYDFTAIALQVSSNKLQTQINESTFIYTLKPNLNHPYINPLLAKHHINIIPRFNPPLHQLGVYGLRLWRRARRLGHR